MPLLLIGLGSLIGGAGLGFGAGVITKEATDKALIVAATGGGLYLGYILLRRGK